MRAENDLGRRTKSDRGQYPVNERVKHLCVVILAQVGCLAVGLWVQQKYLLSSATSAAEEVAWSDMDDTARHLLSELERLDSSSVTPGKARFERMAQQLSVAGAASGNVVFLDSLWRVAALPGDTTPAHDARLAIGTRLSWTPLSDPGGKAASQRRGMLDMPDGPHLAVARAVKGQQGYVVVHRSRADINASTALLLASGPAISALTLLWTCILLGIAAYMILARFHDEAERERSQSAKESLRQRQKLVRMRDAVIFGLAKLADSRDPETGDHLERISIYATTLASTLRSHHKYRDPITPAFVRLIGISSALHDIGKVGIEDRILRKSTSLTPEERTRMESHTMIGGECLREIEQRLGTSNFLQMAREIAFAHHERWDGSGYPNGLKGDEIPLAARIVAIVDVYDALSSRRVYKEPHEHEECVDTIRQEAGKQFDPDLVDVWLTVEPKFAEIARQYADESPSAEAAGPPDAQTQITREPEPGREPEMAASSAGTADE